MPVDPINYGAGCVDTLGGVRPDGLGARGCKQCRSLWVFDRTTRELIWSKDLGNVWTFEADGTHLWFGGAKYQLSDGQAVFSGGSAAGRPLKTASGKVFTAEGTEIWEQDPVTGDKSVLWATRVSFSIDDFAVDLDNDHVYWLELGTGAFTPNRLYRVTSPGATPATVWSSNVRTAPLQSTTGQPLAGRHYFAETFNSHSRCKGGNNTNTLIEPTFEPPVPSSGNPSYNGDCNAYHYDGSNYYMLIERGSGNPEWLRCENGTGPGSAVSSGWNLVKHGSCVDWGIIDPTLAGLPQGGGSLEGHVLYPMQLYVHGSHLFVVEVSVSGSIPALRIFDKSTGAAVATLDMPQMVNDELRAVWADANYIVIGGDRRCA